MRIQNSNPFIVKGAVSHVPGFSRLRHEGNDFLLRNNGQKIYLSLSHSKLRIIFLIITIPMLLMLARVFWLQIIQGKQYNMIAEGNRIRLEKITAERGIIYDRFNNPLVANLPNFSLYFIPADLPQTDVEKFILATKLSKIINKTPQDILQVFQSRPQRSYKPELILDNLEHQQAVALSVAQDELLAIKLVFEPKRYYVENSGLSHILGYTGKISQQELDLYTSRHYDFNDSIGKNGIELYYEDILRGINGRQEIEVDATGKAKKILHRVEPQIGSSLILSIDLDLQKKLTQSLSQAIAASGKRAGGVAVAIDPQSGEILALVSLPDFDNNFFSAGIHSDAYQKYLTDSRKPLFNRAVSGVYPPGSTFKPIVALAALEEGIINEDKTFLSTGGIQIDKWFFPDWKYGGHGRINVITGIAESVNTFFYYIGGGYGDFIGLGVDKIVNYAQKFNLNKKTGIDLPGEAAGFLPSKKWKEKNKGEAWYIGDTYHLAIGQGDILVTPLQVASYMAAIANGGTLYQPHLLKQIENKDNSKYISSFPQSNYIIRQNFIKQENIDIVRRGLRAVVTKGSARSLQSLPVAVAGKTGTAQVGGNKKSHAWFSGFAPYQSPQIVLTILIENGGEGSVVAIPVFKEIIDWYFNEN